MTRLDCAALLLDMDGVLVDSTAAIARVWSRWAARFQMDPRTVVEFAHGRTAFAAIQDLFPDRSPEFHQEEFRWMERGEIEDVDGVVALPGARDLLIAAPFSQRAVVTSASRRLAEVRLRAAGLWDLVGALVTASDIQHGKPNPEPYLKGAVALKIPAHECVVVEDAASGTRAGKAAGAHVIAVRTTSDDASLRAAGADWIVNDCASLRCNASSVGRQLQIEFPDIEIHRLSKMS